MRMRKKKKKVAMIFTIVGTFLAITDVRYTLSEFSLNDAMLTAVSTTFAILKNSFFNLKVSVPVCSTADRSKKSFVKYNKLSAH